MEQLCSLVDDLLDVTRITRNKIVLKKEQVNVRAIAKETAADMRAFFEKKGITLDASIGDAQIIIDADPVRIRQIIENLFHNALKFTESGGKVSITVTEEDKRAVIRLKDSGIGIDPRFIPALFEPFIQADKSLDRRNSGLGLGLSIVKGIAELHGGSVNAYSEGLGKGSEFVLSLPAKS